jgi:hypothetical protein
MAMFQAVIEAYLANYHSGGGLWEHKHSCLFTIKVIGYMVTLLPRRHQLACLQGLKYFVKEDRELVRPLVRDYSAGELFPGDAQPHEVLGDDFNFAICPGANVNPNHSSRLKGEWVPSARTVRDLISFVEQTLQTLQNLRDPASNQNLASVTSVGVSNK